MGRRVLSEVSNWDVCRRNSYNINISNIIQVIPFVTQRLNFPQNVRNTVCDARFTSPTCVTFCLISHNKNHYFFLLTRQFTHKAKMKGVSFPECQMSLGFFHFSECMMSLTCSCAYQCLYMAPKAAKSLYLFNVTETPNALEIMNWL